MGIYVYSGRDGARGAELRKSVRERHLEKLGALDREGRIVFAGPLRDEGGAPCGRVVIFEAESLAAAREIAENDPYVSEGVFGHVDVHESLRVFPSERQGPGGRESGP